MANCELDKNNVEPFSHITLMVNARKVSSPNKLVDTFNNFFSTGVLKLILPQLPHCPPNGYSLLNKYMLLIKI